MRLFMTSLAKVRLGINLVHKSSLRKVGKSVTKNKIFRSLFHECRVPNPFDHPAADLAHDRVNCSSFAITRRGLKRRVK